MTTWACEAYGPEGEAVGALCFFAATGQRTCDSLDVCHARMATERRRVFRRINELATGGSEAFEYLSDEITNPDQLLDSDWPIGDDDHSSH